MTQKSFIKAKISVRDFAQPLRLTGHLHRESSLGFKLDVGVQIHQTIQERLQQEDSQFECEVHLAGKFKRSYLNCELSGRADGIFRHDLPIIEEIKSTFSYEKLLKALASQQDHPYKLQAYCYAYLYREKKGAWPKVQLRVVCSRTGQETLISLSDDDGTPDFDVEDWFEKRLDQLDRLARDHLDDQRRRKNLAGKLKFPFSTMRPGQDKLIEFISTQLKSKSQFLLQAPTGLGKTAGVIYPALRKGLSKGHPLIYTAPKNSLFKNAVEFLNSLGLEKEGLRILVLTAKSKACLKAEVDCHPDRCQFSNNYYDKRESCSLPLDSGLWDQDFFKQMGQDNELCPYELGQENIFRADVIICDYNYLFSLRSNLGERFKDYILPLKSPMLVIDEVHNLPGRAMENLSPSLNISRIHGMFTDGGELLEADERDLFADIYDFFVTLIQGRLPKTLTISSDDFEPYLARLAQLLGVRMMEGDDLSLTHPLVELYLSCLEWQEVLTLSDLYPEIEVIAAQEQSQKVVKALCLNPGFFLKERWSLYYSVLGFSATLKPFDFYAKLCGFDETSLIKSEFQSPFDPRKRKVLVLPQIETTYKRRALHYKRIAEVIGRIIPLKKGHYLVFFPSYQFLENVKPYLQEIPDVDKLISQDSHTTTFMVHQHLAQLELGSDRCHLICGVQGGQMAEGLDYKGLGVKGVFVVGPAVPSFSFERQRMEYYFQKTYQRGRDYTYTYPAMAKSIQAAGRVIRDKDEIGLIIMMDPRFLQSNHLEAFPQDWLKEGRQSLLSKTILNDIKDFWNLHGNPENRL